MIACGEDVTFSSILKASSMRSVSSLPWVTFCGPYITAQRRIRKFDVKWKRWEENYFSLRGKLLSYSWTNELKCFVELNTGLVNSHKGTWKHKEIFRDVILKEYLWERKKMQVKLSWKRKLIHTIATTDQLMLVLKLSYENCIKAEHALINTSENEVTHILPLNVPRVT